jgi:hypothetical protein
MSYIQIELGGVKRGLKFLQGAVMEFREKIDFSSIAATGAYAIVWAGLKCNAHVKGEPLMKTVKSEDGKDVEVPLTYEDVCEMVDELSDDTLVMINDCWTSSQAYRRLIEKADAINAEDDDKKKLTEEQSTEPIVTKLEEDA